MQADASRQKSGQRVTFVSKEASLPVIWIWQSVLKSGCQRDVTLWVSASWLYMHSCWHALGLPLHRGWLHTQLQVLWARHTLSKSSQTFQRLSYHWVLRKKICRHLKHPTFGAVRILVRMILERKRLWFARKLTNLLSSGWLSAQLSSLPCMLSGSPSGLHLQSEIAYNRDVWQRLTSRPLLKPMTS